MRQPSGSQSQMHSDYIMTVHRKSYVIKRRKKRKVSEQTLINVKWKSNPSNSTLSIHAAHWQSNGSVFMAGKVILPIKHWTNIQTKCSHILSFFLSFTGHLHFHSFIFHIIHFCLHLNKALCKK